MTSFFKAADVEEKARVLAAMRLRSMGGRGMADTMEALVEAVRIARENILDEGCGCIGGEVVMIAG